MSKPIVVNMFAGPGTGKSTTAAAVFSLLKMHHINVELITEFAKDLAWEERFNTMNNQAYIWGKQYHRMWRIKDQVDIMVTDGPIIFGLVYGKDNPKHFNELVLETFNNFDNINYFLKRVKPYNPKGRVQSEEKAKQLDNEMFMMLETHDIKFKTVDGSFHGINIITEQVLDRLGKEMIIHLKDNIIT